MKFVLAFCLALTSGAAWAQDEACFQGEPKLLTYANGGTARIIQRHGTDVTYTTPIAGGNDAVTKTHIILFPKTNRSGARMTEYRWDTRLPRVEDLVPGFQYDVEGTIKVGDAAPLPYRIVGDVQAMDPYEIGKCSYPTVLISTTTFVAGTEAVKTTVAFSPEMVVVLASDGLDVATGKEFRSRVVGLE